MHLNLVLYHEQISDAIFTIEENTLSSHSRIDDIAQLIKSQPKAGNRPRAVVCSAMGKTTLLCAGKLALGECVISLPVSSCAYPSAGKEKLTNEFAITFRGTSMLW